MDLKSNLFFPFTIAQIKGMSFKEKLSHKRLNKLLKNVLEGLKGDTTTDTINDTIQHSFCKYMYDHDVPLNEDATSEFEKMMTETISLFESKDCSMVINQCLESSLDYVVESLSDNFLGNEGNELF